MKRGHDMNIKQLQYFVSIIDYGGFSKAARHLFMTQPALSTAIKKLESEVNTPLLICKQDKIILTEAGQYLYDNSKPLLNQFNALINAMQQFKPQHHEKIVVGLPTLFAMQFMPIFSTFMINHPDVDLILTQGGSGELQSRLSKGDIDLGILSFPQYESNIIIDPFRQFKGYTVCVVAPEEHPLATYNSVNFNQLIDERFSSLSTDFILGRYLNQQFELLHLTPNIVYTDNNWEVILSSLKNLNTICLMAKEYEHYYPKKDLKWIPLNNNTIQFPIGIAYLRQKIHSPKIRALIDMLQST